MKFEVDWKKLGKRVILILGVLLATVSIIFGLHSLTQKMNLESYPEELKKIKNPQAGDVYVSEKQFMYIYDGKAKIWKKIGKDNIREPGYYPLRKENE